MLLDSWENTVFPEDYHHNCHLSFFWYQYGMICLHLSTLNLGAVSTTHIDYASGLTRLEIYLHICKTARLGKPVPSQQWVKSSPCISGSPQAFFPRLQCSYFKWECSGGGGGWEGSPNPTTMFQPHLCEGWWARSKSKHLPPHFPSTAKHTLASELMVDRERCSEM